MVSFFQEFWQLSANVLKTRPVRLPARPTIENAGKPAILLKPPALFPRWFSVNGTQYSTFVLTKRSCSVFAENPLRPENQNRNSLSMPRKRPQGLALTA